MFGTVLCLVCVRVYLVGDRKGKFEEFSAM